MLQIQVDLCEIQMCVLSVHHSEMPSLTECSHISAKIRQIVSMCTYGQEMFSNNLSSQALCTLDDLGVQGKYNYCLKFFI